MVPLGPGGGLRYIWGGKKSNEKWNSKGASGLLLGRVHKHSLADVFWVLEWQFGASCRVTSSAGFCFLIFFFGFFLSALTCGNTQERVGEKKKEG
jgi:hypothetical protein